MTWQYIDIRTVTQAEYNAWYAMADDDRRKKCDVCRVPEDRVRSLAGDHLAREGLARLCGVDPAGIRFGRSDRGKPFATGLEAHFNISHSGNFVVCAVSERSVGIDVEQLRPVRSRLAQKVCTPAELSYIQEAPGWGDLLSGEAMVRFFRIWTAKEAYFKWTGTGITNLKSVDTLEHIRTGGTFELEGHVVSIFE